MFRRTLLFAVCWSAFCLTPPFQPLHACTGITLRAQDGAVVYGRTMEWGAFDLNSRVAIFPRGAKFSGQLPDGKTGLTWTAKYGVAGLDGLGKNLVLDGMNEKGLTVGIFYHPGVAEYQEYDPAKASQSLSPTDLGQYLITTCASVAEVRERMKTVRVIPLVEESIQMVPGVHYILTEPSGKAVVIEFLKGKTTIFDAPLGVITNAPSYDWHETNLRNYINLSPVALPGRKIGDLDFKPLGAGSGMIGLPGDFTPPSRFIRAVAFSKTARPTKTGDETMYELFRILDNFNVPLASTAGDSDASETGLRSSTLWTTCNDTKNRVIYYHTQNNRRVRKIDVSRIDFATLDQKIVMPLDKEKTQDIEDRTP